MHRNKKTGFFYLQKISQGTILSVLIMLIVYTYNKNLFPGEILLHETIPHYQISLSNPTFYKYDAEEAFASTSEEMTTSPDEPIALEDLVVIPESDIVNDAVTAFIVEKIEDINGLESIHDVIGLNDVIYQPETDNEHQDYHIEKEILTIDDIELLRDLNNLREKFYIVDKRTALTAADFDVDGFVNANLQIDNTLDGPKVLIFHTHSNEMYSDSNPGNKMEGVMGAGEKLTQILSDKYGIQTMHHTGSYDLEDGKSMILGAYERMEPDIRKILADHPSIQVAIDLHRDGVNESTHLVTNINGKPTAQIMFFNGLSKLMQNGELVPIDNLPNVYLKDNLAMSFIMQLTANKLYPNFTRKVYLNAYRYSNHMLPKSMLVEVGAQTNTMEEAFNAMEPLAEILADVIR